MNRRLICLCVSFALATLPALALAKEPKKPHTLRGSVELETRSNNNIALAPSSASEGFDFAGFGDFVDPEEEESAGDDEGGDEDEGDIGDDIEGDDYDEDELEEDDAADEDGDGIDDLLDPDVDSTEDSERRNAIKFGLQHKYQAPESPMSWGTTFKAVGDYHQDRDELDKVNMAIGTGPEFTLPDKRFKLKLLANYVRLEQNDKSFLSTFVGSLALDFQATKAVGFDVAYNYQDKDVTNPDSPDAIVNTLTFGMEWKASKNDIFKAKYSPKVEDSSRVTKNKDTSGWQFTYSRKLPWEMILGLGIKQDTVDYKNLDPRREDDILAYTVNLDKKFNDNWFAALSWEKRERDSNLPGKDGENRSVVISATYKF